MEQQGFRASDRGSAAAIWVVFFILYAALRKADVLWDGGYFLKCAGSLPVRNIPYHPLYIPALHAAIALGKWIGLKPYISGSLLSAATMAGAIAVFFLFLRRAGIAALTALLFAALMGLSNTAIENGTCVEVYGPSMLVLTAGAMALWIESVDPRPRHKAALAVACILIVLFHVGFAFWVLGIYTGLAFQRRRSISGAAACLAQGLAVLIALLLVCWMIGVPPGSADRSWQFMLKTFFTPLPPLEAVGIFFSAPMDNIFFNMGLMLFPCLAGWTLMRREWPGFAAATIFATAVSLIFFIFWPPDKGEFYFPLAPLWGLLAAAGAQKILERTDARRIAAFCALLAIGSAAIFLAQKFPGPPAPPGQSVPAAPWRILAFWAWLAAMPFLVSGLPNAAMRRSSRAAILAVGAVALTLQAAAYVPEAFRAARNGLQRESLAALLKVDPVADASLIRLVTPIDAAIIYEQAGIRSLPSDEFGKKPQDFGKFDDVRFAASLRDTGDPRRPIHLWLDATSMKLALENRNKGIFEDIPFELIDFAPHRMDGFVFYRATFKHPGDADLYWRREDPYPVENWGGVPVVWLRPIALLPLPKNNGVLELKYWIGNPAVDANHPVQVRIEVSGNPPVVETRDAVGGYSVRLPLDLSAATSPTLTIRTDPGWVSPEDRHLGVALYPMQWL